MTIFLRQSTAAQHIAFGPAVGPTDGVTLVTNLVGTGANQLEHTSSGILISKNGGAMAARTATAGTSTYRAYGFYDVILDGTDTNTLGDLTVAFAYAAGCLPILAHCTVLTAKVYDALIAGTEYLRTHPGEFGVSGTTFSAKKVDGTTQQFSQTLTKTTGADPVTGLAPT
jgi:hypothetical protein